MVASGALSHSVLQIRGGAYRYPALVGTGLLDQVGEHTRKYLSSERCAIISDSHVAPLFANRVKKSLVTVGLRPTLITIPAGEKSKTLQQAGAICDQMIAAGLDRQSFVIGLGGGVVGDISGFVAAIYHRGIPHVQIPTTLLAMVDSSIGGKTGVNTRDGKNLIGAIHHPLLVIDDLDVLKTLPRHEFNQGCAEIIKHAVIADAKMFQTLQSWKASDALALQKLIKRNIAIKSNIVTKDERDRIGERARLNFGHTVGHAIERAGGYRKFLHGEALSLGIVAACAISIKHAALPPGQRDTIVDLLRQFNLPTRLPKNFPRKKTFDTLKFDKKFEGGRVRFVVTPRIGAARLTNDVTLGDIRKAVEQL
ncbi:MAG: 3-dehydroquinate synthase [Verrucomicrobia bacterium]|nr:MAG: 3-dehydroquinate synthase [Verrucomicrobiota bacterium]PYL62984.1 MAG: 3-dehydroquinate synthase [Verrucomicrobiota bacterium]